MWNVHSPQLAVLRDMGDFFQLPQPRRERRPVPPPRVDRNPVVIVLSDTYLDDATVAPPQRPPVVDLDSSLETLPDIDPRPQHQLPVEPLFDPGPLDITTEFPPPLQHQALREAYVLLNRLQLPPLQPLTPPPELPVGHLTPPPEPEADWAALEQTVAHFVAPQQHLLPPPPLVLQQPFVLPQPLFVPAFFTPPPPLPPVDWAMIAYALFTIAEREGAPRGHNTH